jgi:DNA-binding XRE family transcriptional regulator
MELVEAQRDNERIAEAIRALLGMHALKQDDLAQMLGVSRQTVYLWLAGETAPRGQNARNLIRAFGIDANTWGELEYGEAQVGDVLVEASRQYHTCPLRTSLVTREPVEPITVEGLMTVLAADMKPDRRTQAGKRESHPRLRRRTRSSSKD